MNSFFSIFSGISAKEWQVFLAILVAASALIGRAMYVLGKAQGWNDRRQDRDRDNIIVASLIFDRQPDGSVIFGIETDDKLPSLSDVFGNPRLESIVRRNVTRREVGVPIFDPGKDHYLAMERASIHITGPDAAATQSAMFHRKAEFHTDLVATTLIYARGEDGLRMAHLVKANPHDLESMLDPSFVASLVPLRTVHGDYIPIAARMAEEHRLSQYLFRSDDERSAGQRAMVWTVPVRTQRVLTEADFLHLLGKEESRVAA